MLGAILFLFKYIKFSKIRTLCKSVMDTPVSARKQILDRYEANQSQKKISQDLNIPKSTVSDIIRHNRNTGSVESLRRNCGGHNKVLSARDERLIARSSLAYPQATALQISDKRGLCIPRVSVSTIRRSLQAN